MEHTHTKKKGSPIQAARFSAHAAALHSSFLFFFFLLTFIMSLDMINRLIKADFCAAWIFFFFLSFQRVLPQTHTHTRIHMLT